jgi:hypothetical protein
MKKLLVALAAVLVTAASYGQGQVNFNNLDALADKSKGIYRPDGTTGAGAGITAQLFLVGAGGVLTALTPPTTFFTDPGAEFLLNPVDVTVPNVAGGGSATFRVQAWDTQLGSYTAALAANGLRGESGDFVNKVGGGTLPPENTVFTGFTMVPEPSTIALGVIGAAALLLRRRK